MKVKDVMSKKVVSCSLSDTGQSAAQLMEQYDIGSIPIVDSRASQKLVGTVTDRDLCMKLVAEGRSSGTRVGTLMTEKVVTCHADDALEACEALMQKHQIRRIPVVDADGRCVGIVAQADIALRDDAEHTKRTVSAISQPRASHTAHKGKDRRASAAA